MIPTLAIVAMLAGPQGGCRGVSGDRILAADLAREIDAFQSVAGDVEVALAPAPGARRLFLPADVLRLAARFGVQVEAPRAVCFERQLRPLDPEKVRAALEESLAGLAAQLEVIEYPRAPVPEGTVEFPRFGLGRPAGQAPALWRGRIRYGGGRSYPIWARVRVSVERVVVVGRRMLTAGSPIDAGSIEVRKIKRFPFDQPAPGRVEEVVGKLPRRPIAAGEPIEARQLVAPRDVEAGSNVEVQARSGAARLIFSARAESSGRTGDTVVVRNPITGKRFRAVIEAKGKVAVEEAANPDAQIPPVERDDSGFGGSSGGRQETR